MSIVKNQNRVGRFTSSNIASLIKEGRGKNDVFSVAGMTYIKTKYLERKLKRSTDLGGGGRSANWGLFLEQFVYSHFSDLGYEILADKTHSHPTIKSLSGSADLVKKGVKVGDIKCYEPLKFAQMVDCFKKDDLDLFKKEFAKEYWQLVSNAMIHGVKEAESIVYMPTVSELAEIRELASNYDGADQWKYRFIYESEDHELAFLPEDSEYESFNSYQFTVPQEDIDLLTSRLELAEKEIEKMQQTK
ncbi:MAG: hypothetical protein ACI9JN_001266 [Bacteroidia bacterium]|jgi:hypothetical protein